MTNASPRWGTAAAYLASLVLLGACTTGEREAPVSVPVPVAVTPAPSPGVTGPVLNADGTCSQAAPGTATVIEPGIGECDLVRLKAKPATDVLVGEGRSGREVQVLYSEPGAKELYFFVNGRLNRIVKS
ncbi:hypothetical protein [Methylobacterium sp. Leaf106]|uniref:hypothetical protein n=1 Tax=Methylobacterium sp. Leaf106 TaxID=1736255 RepID=UPI0006F70BDD|nr:hypothetical protein [Methylobacterium sp. Leaf106]KQP52178.1 hypothetical protein ASF34_18690 [Methylobacterium sp. Leaf106]